MAVAQRPATLPEDDFAPQPGTRVYVWEWPVRICHWTIVFALIALSITGYYIHNPFIGSDAPTPGTGESPAFLLGTVRFIHESVGFIFVAAVLFRIYWAFAGNRYAHWRAIVPHRREQWLALKETLAYYAFRRRRPLESIGHNQLAGIAYMVLYVGFLISAFTGLALFAWIMDAPPWSTLFGWITSVFPVSQVRAMHFFLMFAFWAFFIHHIYSAILADLEERNGEVSSIFTGFKTRVERHREPKRQAK